MYFRRRKPAQHPARITFVTRAGCCLCDDALPVVQAVAQEFAAELNVVDVDGGPQWSQYHAHVPVILLNGEQFSYWVVDDQALRAKLAQSSSK